MGRRRNHRNIQPGDRFGTWTVTEQIVLPWKDRNRKGWRLRCDCGVEGQARGMDLVRGRSGGCRACYEKATEPGTDLGHGCTIVKRCGGRRVVVRCACGDEREVFWKSLKGPACQSKSWRCRSCYVKSRQVHRVHVPHRGRMISLSEAAELLGVKIGTVYSMRCRGQLEERLKKSGQ